MNYIKLFEDGTSEAVDVKPSWGMYEKEHALDNREVYIDGNWYSTTGGELVTNGDFVEALDSGAYILGNSASISIENEMLKLSGTTVNYPYASVEWTGLVVDATYIAKIGTVSGANAYAEIGTTVASNNIATGAIGEGSKYVKFIAQTSSIFFTYRLNGVDNQIGYFDNISVYKTEPTIDTLQLPHTYLSNKGKLAGIEVANGIPVDIHYDELAPTLVEDTIKVSNLVVTDSFDLGQSWVDVTGERALGVTYTNTTGKLIEVTMFPSQQSNMAILGYIDGVLVYKFASGVTSNGSYTITNMCILIVPPNSTYMISPTLSPYATAVMDKWHELR